MALRSILAEDILVVAIQNGKLGCSELICPSGLQEGTAGPAQKETSSREGGGFVPTTRPRQSQGTSALWKCAAHKEPRVSPLLLWASQLKQQGASREQAGPPRPWGTAALPEDWGSASLLSRLCLWSEPRAFTEGRKHPSKDPSQPCIPQNTTESTFHLGKSHSSGNCFYSYEYQGRTDCPRLSSPAAVLLLCAARMSSYSSDHNKCLGTQG